MNRRPARRLGAMTSVLLAAATAGAAPPAPAPSPTAVARPILELPAPAARRPHLTVPAAAVVERGGMPGVMVVHDDGRARFRLVKPGERSGASVEVIAGLFGGERIVTGDLDDVRDGTPIKAQD